jgi:glycosyltransferase involved in cell wall biosynthesis
MPKVSIIMNCYNGEKYLREAMDSVFAQTYQDWEIVFWDNNSSDASPQIAKSYGDPRVKYFRSASLTNLGEARRNAVNEASGEWVGFIDCDDIWYPEKLTVQLNALEGTDYVFAYAGIIEMTAAGEAIRTVVPKYASGDILEHLLNQFDVNMVTPMIRRSFLVDHQINFEPEITASEEYNLFVRLAARGTVLVQKNILGRYRVYSGSLTDRQISRWAIERHITLRQLSSEVPSVPQIYARAYREAEMRGDYYEARYLVSEGKFGEAKKIMKRIGAEDWWYKMLGLSLYFPGLWGVIHGSRVRRKLLSIIKR